MTFAEEVKRLHIKRQFDQRKVAQKIEVDELLLDR